MQTQTDQFVIQMVSQPKYLCVVRAAVETTGRVLGFTPEECGQLALVVDEALANVIRHGYAGRTDLPIWIRIEPCRQDERDGIRIVLEDESENVDIEAIKGRALEEVRPGGLGVNIIRQVMDDVRYSMRDENKGLRLEMCKYTQAHASAEND